MKTKALELAPDYYKNYVNLVADGPFLALLENGGIELFTAQQAQLEALGDATYAPGKWTIREIIQHLIDTERIFVNRALRFVRNDQTELPGYDHDAYVPASRVSHRTVADLLEEYRIVREGTVQFFTYLNEEELLRKGNANGVSLAVITIAYVLIGHPTHHYNVIMERYMA